MDTTENAAQVAKKAARKALCTLRHTCIKLFDRSYALDNGAAIIDPNVIIKNCNNALKACWDAYGDQSPNTKKCIHVLN